MRYGSWPLLALRLILLAGSARGKCRPDPKVVILTDRSEFPVAANRSAAAGFTLRGQCGGNDGSSLELPLGHFQGRLPNYYGGRYPLDADAFRRSLVNSGDWRMRRLIRRVQSGGEVHVVVVGGSAALGMGEFRKGLVPGGPSTSRFAAWLKARYPHARIRFSNLAATGTTTAWRILEFEAVRKSAPDLLIWDYAANDFMHPHAVS